MEGEEGFSFKETRIPILNKGASCSLGGLLRSASESVEGASLSLQSVDNIEGGDSLALGVLGVGHAVADDGFKEVSEDTAGLVVDSAGDALNSATSGESSDSGLGDAKDGVLDNALSDALGANLSVAAFAGSFSFSRHVSISSFLILQHQSGI